MDTDLNERYRFMRDHAGYIVGQRAIGALELARAEQLLERARDLEVAWLHWEWDDVPFDQDIVDDETAQRYFDEGTWTGPFYCVLESEQHDFYASLSGIVVGPQGTNDPYCRVVAAELALEVVDDLRQAIGDALDARGEDIATVEACPYCGDPKERHSYVSRTTCVVTGT